MRWTSRCFPALSIVLLGSVLAGCAARKTATYDNEGFNESATYSRSYTATATDACESARRALLSQGYVITKGQPDVVDGRKKFQQASEAHAEIEFHIVCAPDSADSTSSTVFVNAVQDRYTLKKTASSASLGVSLLGSVSMPFGASDDSMVKVGSETIAAPRFYNGFFGLLEQYLAPLQARAAAAAQAAQAQAQAAQAAQAQAAALAQAAQAQAIASEQAAKAQALAAAHAQAAAAAQAQAAATAQAQAAAAAQAQAQAAAASQAQDAASAATGTKPADIKPADPAVADAKAAEFRVAESRAAGSMPAKSKAADQASTESGSGASPGGPVTTGGQAPGSDVPASNVPSSNPPAPDVPAGNGLPAN